jgi:hypothetical protein
LLQKPGVRAPVVGVSQREARYFAGDGSMTGRQYADQSLFRRCLSTYLVALPWGRWPVFSAQTKAGRRRILMTRNTGTLLTLFLRTNLWYLRYLYQYLTSAIRKEPTFFSADAS